MSVSLYGSGNTVIQVLQGSITSTTLSVVNGAAFATTGISATITPQSTNSKILVTPNLTNIYVGAGIGVGFAIYRGSTQIYVHGYGQGGGYIGSLYSAAGGVLSSTSFSYLDSPATTSATTYTIYWGAYGGTAYLNYSTAATVLGTGSYVILQEISGS